MRSGWTPAPSPPWGLAAQCESAGFELPVLERSRDGQAWRFESARVLAHHCRVAKACEFCAAAKRNGYTALRVTAASVKDGTALNEVGRVLWASGAQKGLFE